MRESWGSLGILNVGEMAERFQCDQFARLRYRDRGCGKGAARDRFAQNGEGGSKDVVLIIEGRGKRWGEVGQGLDTR